MFWGKAINEPEVGDVCHILGNNKVSGQLEKIFAGIPQEPLETSPGTIKIIQKRFQGPPARGFWNF